ncbi:BTAD domain-containing putative transcriptional regulator [Micromonospora sp. NPDC049101]|uniref:AfsR/SARP family transcriptional regulator n=1 Tax=Micromonospora sp. NPDC049101 TaxID=3155032 RepID=UPI0033F68442
MTPVFRFLGPLEISTPQSAVSLTAPRHQIVLAKLLLDVNHVVPIDDLVRAVWDAVPPSTARTQIQICISRIRRAFSDAGLEAQIASYRPGYLLQAAEETLDVFHFNRAIADGRAAAADNRLDTAVEKLRAGLGMWRGEPFSGIDSLAIKAAAVRLSERQLNALEECHTLELKLGRHHDLIDELMHLVQRHPLHEQARSNLVLALYRCGRQAEALEAYREARHTFVTELGIEPGEDLRRLEQAILLADPELDVPGASEQTKAWALACPPEPPAVVESVRVPRMLPADDPAFTGHDDTVVEMMRHLGGDSGQARSLTVSVITGRAGVGKTALAVRVAHRLATEFPDGQIYLRLDKAEGQQAGVRETLNRMLRMLGVSGCWGVDDTEEVASLYRSAVNGRRLLIVLDEVRDEAQITPLLPGSSTCAVIITSRQRMVRIPGAQLIEINDLSFQHATELLTVLVGGARASAEPAAVLELIDMCGGLPLALRIAGARLAARPHWAIAQLNERMADERHRLDELVHGGLGVREGMAAAYASVPPSAQNLFRLLSLFDVPDLPGWIAGPVLGTESAGEDLEHLVDARLIEARQDHGVMARYHLHKLIQVYARELLADQESDRLRALAIERATGAWQFLADEAHRRLHGGDYIVLHGAAPRWSLPPEVVNRLLRDPLEWLESERTALVDSVRQTAEVGLSESCWDLAITLVALFEARGYFDDWRDTHAVALAACRQTNNQRGEAVMLYSQGTLSMFEQRYDEAAARFSLARRVFEKVGEVHGLALCLRNMAFLDRVGGRSKLAEQRYQRALELMRKVQDPVGEAHILSNVAQLRMDSDDLDAAEEMLDKAMAIAVGIGNRRVQAQVHHSYGDICLSRGQAAAAEKEFRQALDMVREVRDQAEESYVLCGLGLAQVRLRHFEDASRTLRHGYALAEAGTDLTLVGRFYVAYAEMDSMLGDYDGATYWADRAVKNFSEKSAAVWRAIAFRLIDEIRQARSSVNRAGYSRPTDLAAPPDPPRQQ